MRTQSRRVIRMGFAILAIVCGSGAGVWADLSNGGFENGGADWSWEPTDSVEFLPVEFFGPSSYAAVLQESQPGNDTYLEQTFQLLDGETTLRFDYRLDAEGDLPPETDWLRLSLDGQVYDVASTSGLTLANSSRQGTWSLDVSGLPHEQDLTLRFTLAGESDGVSTTVAIDNVSSAAAPVPVPGAILLGAVGLGCATWRLRRGAPRSQR